MPNPFLFIRRITFRTMNSFKIKGPETRRVLPRISRLWILVVTAIAIFMSVGVLSSSVNADSTAVPTVQILSHSAVSKLPDGLEFTANVIGNVKEVTARFSILGRRATQYDYLDFGESGSYSISAPANGTLFYRTDTLARYLPPGVTMEYTIEVLDFNGRTFETEPTQIVLTDSRFDWDTVSEGGVTVY